MEIVSGDTCGADKPFETLTVTSPAGEKKYTDSFCSCRGGDNVHIDNIGGVFGALRDAAGL